MSKLAFSIITLTASLMSSSTYADKLTIEGSGISRDLSCSSDDVDIYGANNTIIITGKCKDIVVYGASHTVTFEEAKDVKITGADNKVTGGSAENISIEVSDNVVSASLKSIDDVAELEVSGVANTVNVKLESAAKIEVSGASHKVDWSKAEGNPEPKISISGADNAVQKTKD